MTSAYLQGFYVTDDTSWEADFQIGRTRDYELTQHLNFNDGGRYTTYTRRRSGDTVFVFCFLERLIPNTQWHYRLRINTHNIYYEYSNDESLTTLTDSTSGGFMIPIYFEGIISRGFGVHSHGTNCTDYTLGEEEVPPLPPSGSSDLRFRPPRNEAEVCYGQGLYVDLRPFTSNLQRDTFKIKFQSLHDGEPAVIRWGNPEALYTGDVRLLYPLDGSIISTDMKAHLMDTIPGDIDNLYIIAEGPTNLLSAWFTFVGSTSTTLKGMYDPNGISTDAWFEWDTTKEYRNATPHQNIGSATAPVAFDAQISGLLPNVAYYYRVVTQRGKSSYYGIDQSLTTSYPVTNVPNNNRMATTFSLYQNYPNPFNPSTEIQYTLVKESRVSLKLYNVLGEDVVTLVNEVQNEGYKSVTFNAITLPSGMYFYRLIAGDFTAMKKMILLK